MAIRFFRLLAAVAAILMTGIIAAVSVLGYILPDRYYVAEGEEFCFPDEKLNIRTSSWAETIPRKILSKPGNSYSMKLSLPCGAMIKTVDVEVIKRNTVIPAGTPFGIKMFTDGVMVVGLTDLDVSGKTVNPAKNAGIKTGDIIVSIDGQKVLYNEDVGRIVGNCDGREMEVTYIRNGEVKHTAITPQREDVGNGYRAGMWVRDSSAGIGTMTYYDPHKQTFAGLGHAICDVDTGEVMPLSTGEAVDVTITGVSRGSSGFPGELKGSFSSGRVIGKLSKNDETGIYGSCSIPPAQHKAVPMATRSEIHAGAAQIYATVKGREPRSFDAMIEKVSVTDNGSTKNMVIKITDPELLEITGGIVQGMSGSPILQDGKLVGAVTHVCVFG